jgi:hypothetical protein
VDAVVSSLGARSPHLSLVDPALERGIANTETRSGLTNSNKHEKINFIRIKTI